MADYLTDMARHERKRRAMMGKPDQPDKRAIMSRLPPDMLTDLRALHTAFGTRADWIAVDGETLLGTEPDRSGRAVPVKQHPAAGGKV